MNVGIYEWKDKAGVLRDSSEVRRAMDIVLNF
jgi:hypothetical protein